MIKARLIFNLFGLATLVLSVIMTPKSAKSTIRPDMGTVPVP
jgi:hypothetical protein